MVIKVRTMLNDEKQSPDIHPAVPAKLVHFTPNAKPGLIRTEAAEPDRSRSGADQGERAARVAC